MYVQTKDKLIKWLSISSFLCRSHRFLPFTKFHLPSSHLLEAWSSLSFIKFGHFSVAKWTAESSEHVFGAMTRFSSSFPHFIIPIHPSSGIESAPFPFWTGCCAHKQKYLRNLLLTTAGEGEVTDQRRPNSPLQQHQQVAAGMMCIVQLQLT